MTDPIAPQTAKEPGPGLGSAALAGAAIPVAPEVGGARPAEPALPAPPADPPATTAGHAPALTAGHATAASVAPAGAAPAQGRRGSRKPRCADCFFEQSGLCALLEKRPCPTFRPAHPDGLRPPQQLSFVFRQERRSEPFAFAPAQSW